MTVSQLRRALQRIEKLGYKNQQVHFEIPGITPNNRPVRHLISGIRATTTTDIHGGLFDTRVRPDTSTKVNLV